MTQLGDAILPLTFFAAVLSALAAIASIYLQRMLTHRLRHLEEEFIREATATSAEIQRSLRFLSERMERSVQSARFLDPSGTIDEAEYRRLKASLLEELRREARAGVQASETGPGDLRP